MAIKIPSVTLNDGTSIPVMGYGTGTVWFLRKVTGTGSFQPELVDMIKSAIQQGYRHIDCAEGYGTEEEVGVAIKECGIPREELFITTKVLETIEDVPHALDTSLKKLQLDYVDLYLIHNPFYTKDDTDLQLAWKAMEEVQRSGKAKAIGVSRFFRSHMEAVLKIATIKPAVIQMEYHPYVQRTNNYVSWLQEQGIAVMSFFGLVPITHARDGPLAEPLAAIAKKHGVDPSAVLTRWQLNRNILPLSTSTKPERLQQYFDAFNLELTPEEMDLITEIGKTHHYRVTIPGFYNPDDPNEVV